MASGSQRDLSIQNLLEPLSVPSTGTLDGNSYNMPDVRVGNDAHEITHDRYELFMYVYGVRE